MLYKVFAFPFVEVKSRVIKEEQEVIFTDDKLLVLLFRHSFF